MTGQPWLLSWWSFQLILCYLVNGHFQLSLITRCCGWTEISINERYIYIFLTSSMIYAHATRKTISQILRLLKSYILSVSREIASTKQFFKDRLFVFQIFHICYLFQRLSYLDTLFLVSQYIHMLGSHESLGCICYLFPLLKR